MGRKFYWGKEGVRGERGEREEKKGDREISTGLPWVLFLG